MRKRVLMRFRTGFKITTVQADESSDSISGLEPIDEGRQAAGVSDER